MWQTLELKGKGRSIKCDGGSAQKSATLHRTIAREKVEEKRARTWRNGGTQVSRKTILFAQYFAIEKAPRQKPAQMRQELGVQGTSSLNLVPRGRDPSGLHQGSRPLAGSKKEVRNSGLFVKSDWLKMQSEYAAHAKKNPTSFPGLFPFKALGTRLEKNLLWPEVTQSRKERLHD